MKKGTKKVVLGVAAHSDDLDFGAFGTFCKFVDDGYDCYYLILTDGSKGSRDPKMTPARLAKIRQDELRQSAKMAGIKDVFFLGHADGELVADLKLRKEIVRYIRRLKPDIVVTQDPTYMYSERFVNHADHRAAGTATIDAVFPAARNPMTFPELKKEGLDHHRVAQMYLMNMQTPNYAVDITKYIDRKIKGLGIHKSQGIGQNPEWMRQMSANLGKKWKYKHAETFFKIDFAI